MATADIAGISALTFQASVCFIVTLISIVYCFISVSYGTGAVLDCPSGRENSTKWWENIDLKCDKWHVRSFSDAFASLFGVLLGTCSMRKSNALR